MDTDMIGISRKSWKNEDAKTAVGFRRSLAGLWHGLRSLLRHEPTLAHLQKRDLQGLRLRKDQGGEDRNDSEIGNLLRSNSVDKYLGRSAHQVRQNAQVIREPATTPAAMQRSETGEKCGYGRRLSNGGGSPLGPPGHASPSPCNLCRPPQL